MLRIPYETNGFPAGTIPNGTDELSVTWDDVLWAAVTVGRPNRIYVFRHGDASQYEAVFRLSLIRMALEQRDPTGSRLRRTNAAKTLDPTEKGAVSYFLGMTICKLFASKLLDTPWLLHLDVFRPQLDPVLTGRSRPDLVGRERGAKRWHAFECKGRISRADSRAKTAAKAQAQRLVSINSKSCTLHVGAITYFRGEVLQFYWRDPSPEEKNRVAVSFHADAWRHYYAIVQAMRLSQRDALPTEANAVVTVEGADLSVGVHRAVTRHLVAEDWDGAQRAATEAETGIAAAGYQPDGLLVRAGPSWSERFTESQATLG